MYGKVKQNKTSRARNEPQTISASDRERESSTHTHIIAKQHQTAEYQFSDVPEKNPFSMNHLCGIANERRTERAA